MIHFPRNTVAIIPAAGTKRGGNSNVSDAMLTVAGKPAIFWTLQEIISCRLERICIIVKTRGNDLEKFVRLNYEGLADIRFEVPDQFCGVGYSVSCGVNALSAEGVPTLVVLGDTIFTPKDYKKNTSSWVSVAEVGDQSRWCMALLEGEAVTALYDKPLFEVAARHACTGIYYFNEGLPLAELDRQQIISQRGRLEMVDYLLPLVIKNKLRAQVTTNWLDVGNADHLQEARCKLVQSRSFNSLSFDEQRGSITKRSTYTSKFYDEINYFKLLPENLKVYFPRVIECSNLPDKQFITLEYYAYPTLADLFLFEEMQVGVRRKIFTRLKSICGDFSEYNYGLDSAAAQGIYLDKNIGRFQAYLTAPCELTKFYLSSSKLSVNGISVPSPQAVIEKSEPLLKRIAENTKWTPIHGDLCFSNILCEPDSCLIKLLDPRGSFGKQGVLGDIRYDIAKLTHSVIGRYDFIVNDLFLVEVKEPGQLLLEMPFRVDMKPIVAEFEAIFLADEIQRKEVLLITAWLFLSMLPLHADKPKRQLAMLATGLKIFSEINN
jgi:dTDP-glucose pyrophosphorylase